MKRQRRPRSGDQAVAREIRALIRRGTGECLLVRDGSPTDPNAAPADGSVPAWDFPGGRCAGLLPADEELRRLCRVRLGIDVGALFKQLWFDYGHGTQTVRYQLFFATVDADDALPLGFAEVRWVHPRHFAELDLAPAAARIAHLVQWD